ncbi:GlxA family transcriptional regulator [Pseudomonas cavernicola]|uniref:GlxA family transcriptional regulator n=1 Tax=Pseudomonas cavernicola TaxID=2320866 RepID=A0A418XIS3_9PSED|nr:GlxA family transcriptional regulator [Pseudomonas cavernicola]
MATEYTRHAPHTRALESIGFLLVNNFTLMAMASAVEPLRLANQLSGQELYRWHTLTLDGRPVWASNGLQISPSAASSTAPAMDALIVCGGKGIQRSCTAEQAAWLRAQAEQGLHLGGLCSGSWALAAAGLLDGYDCSVDWEYLLEMQEGFPQVAISPQLFVIDRDRYTASGGTAPLDMMLRLIGHGHGPELVAQICETLAFEHLRNEQGHQRLPLKHILGNSQPKLQEVVALMESNLREPLSLDELADYLCVSRRQLERLFQKYLYCTPSRYYLKLRLIRARQLLKQTALPMVQVAVDCGFVSAQHFSKCYRELFAVSPTEERLHRCRSNPLPLH